MSHKKYTIVVCLLIVGAGFLIMQAADYLEAHNHPLLSSLTCTETENREDLYWTPNQVGIAETLISGENSVTITLRNTVPNFAGYLYRTDAVDSWLRLEGDRLVLDLQEGQGFLEVRGTTLFGVKLSPVTY
ncbi:MAG: hypothetical protein R3339_08455, partial [Thermodesulfobacteriota bacterium]|nr:hypothetical protein [Thermodesulfobacteriota bacterium]